MPFSNLSRCSWRMILLAMLVLQGCAMERTADRSAKMKKEPPFAKTQKEPAFKQVGKASWYGPGFHGKETANGEIFNQNKLTAAHRTLPLGTKAQVTNVKNGKSVEVKINDRGPYVGDRVIDLSRAAAIKLGMKEQGLATVKIKANSPLDAHVEPCAKYL